MSLTIEILISTMYRTSTEFLDEMFVDNNIDDFYILIVNQTTQDKILKSNNEKIRVLNCFDSGLPKSRNIAIDNSKGNICLIADDDLVYLPNLKQKILDAYEKYPKADLISFEAIDKDGIPYANYHNVTKHNKKSLKEIYSWVITFKRKAIVDSRLYFNHYFGLGSTFKGESEYMFLRNVYKDNKQMVHEPVNIVIHPDYNSGRDMGSDNGFFARSASAQRFFGSLSYVWLLKYTLYMCKDGYIKPSELFKKFKIGLEGIKTYRKLKDSGEINKLPISD